MKYSKATRDAIATALTVASIQSNMTADEKAQFIQSFVFALIGIPYAQALEIFVAAGMEYAQGDWRMKQGE